MSEEEHTTGPSPKSRESMEQAAMQDEQMQEVHSQLMREKEEPKEGFSPVPIFLLFIFAALCFWGGVYLVHYGGDFRADVFDPNFDPAAAAAPRPEISLFDRGAKIYRAQCIACHQADGNGVPGVYPPLVGSDWVTGHSEVLARVLINGLNGPIVVKGNNYNGNMPAFGPGGLNLRSKDLAGVMTYIRQEWGNAAPDMTEDMVVAYLDTYASRSTPWQSPDVRLDLSPDPANAAVAPATEETEVPADESAEEQTEEPTDESAIEVVAEASVA